LNNIFPKAKGVGCLFLYSQALLKNRKIYGIYRGQYKEESKKFF